MGRVVRVNRERVGRNVRQGVDPRAVDARQHWRRIQVGGLPNMGLRCGSAARVIAKSNISDVLVCWIKNQTRDIEIRNRASTANGVQTGERGRTRGGEPEGAVIITGEPIVIILWGNANGANGNASDQWRLADYDVGRALCARAIQAVCAYVDCVVRASRTQGSRAVEVHRVGAGDAIGRPGATTAKKRP
jgi:hypothetical protein